MPWSRRSASGWETRASAQFITRTAAFKVDSSGRCNASIGRSCDGSGQTSTVGSCATPRMCSPGRPTVGRREHRQRSGKRSPVECRVKRQRWRREYHLLWDRVGSREYGGMPSFPIGPCRGGICRFVEREELAVLHAGGRGVREIARRLDRSPSTISRELRRNAATRGGNLEYRATTAQWHADKRGRRPKVAKLAANDDLRQYVHDRLGGVIEAPGGAAVPGPDVRWTGRRRIHRQHRRWAASWSPEQIANRLRVDFPDDESMRISHEAIYQALYVQGRGALRRELTACLRTGRALRVPRSRTRGRGKGFVRTRDHDQRASGRSR